MTIYVTSDLHFWHSNILKYNPENRPWDYVEDMNYGLIHHINNTVGSEDTLISLGDFSFGNRDYTEEIIHQIKCNNIIFILGNHCGKLQSLYEEYGEVRDYCETKVNKTKVVMSHYPMAVWNGSHYGSVMLHGHSHGTYQGKGRVRDVGWDARGRIERLVDVVEEAKQESVVNLDGHTGERK